GRGVAGAKGRLRARSKGRAIVKAKAALDQQLARTGLEFPAFDALSYSIVYGDVPADKSMRHYLSFGEDEGRRPYRNFDPQFYLATYPDVRVAGISPLLHFLTHGVHEGRSPCAELHPLGDLAAAKGMTPAEFYARS